MIIKNDTNSKGFTLIELMVTIAIIGILSSIAYPSYLDSVRKSRRVDATNGMLECAGVQERNYTVGNTYLTNAEAACDTRDDYYTLAVDNTTGVAGCQVVVNGNTRLNCFTITATPVANSSQDDDDICQTLSLTHIGFRSSEDGSGDSSTNRCWRR